jgi:hypothetical protein
MEFVLDRYDVNVVVMIQKPFGGGGGVEAGNQFWRF